MKLRLTVVVAFAAAFAVLPAPAAAAPKPTVTIEEWCLNSGGNQVYGFRFSEPRTGFPPNTLVEGTVLFEGAFEIFFASTSDASGALPGTGGAGSHLPVERIVLTLTWEGGTLTRTLERPCQGPPKPAVKSQCKHRGFVGFGFKNQGDCVSFLATGGKK